MGSAFAIAQRMRCSRWEIGSGLFTATASWAWPPEAQLSGSKEKTADIMEERWLKEAVVALTPWGASLSTPQGQGSLLGHHTQHLQHVLVLSPESRSPEWVPSVPQALTMLWCPPERSRKMLQARLTPVHEPQRKRQDERAKPECWRSEEAARL